MCLSRFAGDGYRAVMTLEAILKDAMSLSPHERAVLADKLWGSVPHDEPQLALTPAQHNDLSKRRHEDDAGESDAQDWEQAQADLRREE